MTGRLPDFLIVGTPRSGTTLVQRLASEIPGVIVPPETHFFTDFAPDLLARHALPIRGDELRRELQLYRERPYFEGVDLDPERMFDALDGSCDSLLALYGSVVDQLSGGAEIVGEKTPGHLLWWEPLARALPRLVLVAVIRDPRAVVASHLELGWGGHPVITARRWLDDVQRVRAAEVALGERCLVLQFEDLVADPAAGRARIAALLGRTLGRDEVAPTPAADALFPAWESWKERAVDGVDSTRAEAWRGHLDAGVAADVVALCRRRMQELGYPDAPPPLTGLRRRASLPPGVRLRLVRARWARRRREAGIRRMSRWMGSPGRPADTRSR